MRGPRDVIRLGVATAPWQSDVTMPNAGDRAKAYRLRKELKAGTIKPIDKLWLANYEDEAAKHARRHVDVGASRSKSGRKVEFKMEEAAEHEAVGSGSAAVAAASAALAAREEGRRLDSLTIEAVGALKEAVNVYQSVCLTMRRRMEVLESSHVEMLEAVREQYLARTQAEINALETAQAGGDAVSRLAEELLPQVLGKRKFTPNGEPKT